LVEGTGVPGENLHLKNIQVRTKFCEFDFYVLINVFSVFMLLRYSFCPSHS
jgi:hypothetical protein